MSERLTESEREVLRRVDGQLRSFVMSGAACTVRVEAGEWTTVEAYVKRILTDRLAARGTGGAGLAERVSALADEWVGTKGGPTASRVAIDHEQRPGGCKCGAQLGDSIDWHWHLVNSAIDEAGRRLRALDPDAQDTHKGSSDG